MNQRFFADYTIGKNAYDAIGSVCGKLGKNVLIIGGKTALSVTETKLKKAMEKFNVIDAVVYGTECTMNVINGLYRAYSDADVDFVIGVGGGKAVDTAKYTARLLEVPFVSVPTLASNCAASSALSVVYNDNHVFEALVHHSRPAYHCFIDTDIILNSPCEFIRAGIGDTMAKYYEVEFSSRNAKHTFSDDLGISISATCRRPLMDNAKKAVEDFKNGICSEELEKVILIIIINTGMVSMLINPDFNGALAHALFYGLTNIKGFEKKYLHGDVVGYAVIVQLLMDNQRDEAAYVRKMLTELGIETTLAQRGVEVSRKALDKIIKSALADPDMKLTAYPVSEDMVFKAIEEAEQMTV